jgi:hypothetical protein
MKKALFAITSTIALAVLFFVMCSPDGPTVLSGQLLPNNISIKSYDVTWDGYKGIATYSGYLEHTGKEKGSLVLELKSYDYNGDSSVMAGLGTPAGLNTYFFKIDALHVDRKPEKATLSADFYDYN